MKPSSIAIQHLSATGLALLGLLSSVSPSFAQVQPAALEPNPIFFNAPPLPPGQGAPSGRRDGGASRGNCPDYVDLAALAPVTDGRVWGQTTSANPTLWFYLPAPVTSAMSMELVVQDAADNLLYETTLTVDVAVGNLAIALPESATLPMNEPHYWTLALFCDPERPEASVFVKGAIERVAADGLETLEIDTERSLTQAQVYADGGIWYDALTVLGELRQADAADADSQSAWTALLEQIGLPDAAVAPVQPCCEPE